MVDNLSFSGECHEIKNTLDFNLITGLDGGYVESVETPESFSCILFKKKI